jgi:hypothetical protein
MVMGRFLGPRPSTSFAFVGKFGRGEGGRAAERRDADNELLFSANRPSFANRVTHTDENNGKPLRNSRASVN